MVLRAIKIQTDNNRIPTRKSELKGKEREAETQTSAEFKAAIPVRFVSKTSGIDEQTQIEDTDLFDFETEVKPMLEVLVERSMNTAVLELKEELEIAKLKDHQERFHKIRNAELVEIQRLEAAEKRKQEEKTRRIEQERAQIEVAKIATSKAISIKISRELFSAICDDSIQSLKHKGFFRDPSLVYLETVYVPNVIQEALRYHGEHSMQIQKICDRIVSTV